MINKEDIFIGQLVDFETILYRVVEIKENSAYNNEHDYEIYSAITTNKVFGPYPSVKTFGGDLFVNIDNTISYFINITDSNKCKEVRSKWKLTNSETEDLNQVTLQRG